MSEPLNWSYRTSEVPEAGSREKRAASEQERAMVASTLAIVSCEQLTADFQIRAIGQGRYRLAGKVSAQLTQSCVVTLDPVAQKLEGVFDVEYWPAGKPTETSDDEVEALSAAEIEPIERGLIDAGRIVFETLSASLDPYPRKPGVQFEARDVEGMDAPAGPFAALKKLKDLG
jgi:uncharacterized metal-binding protein YceD (DUF177 family)